MPSISQAIIQGARDLSSFRLPRHDARPEQGTDPLFPMRTVSAIEFVLVLLVMSNRARRLRQRRCEILVRAMMRYYLSPWSSSFLLKVEKL